jgi:putative membrane protein
LEGDEPDVRFSFANERTFLAWNRTGLALVGAGLVAAQVLDLTSRAAVAVIALALIALGALIAFTSFWEWEWNERSLRLGEPLPRSFLPRVLALGVGLIAVIAGLLVVLELFDGNA